MGTENTLREEAREEWEKFTERDSCAIALISAHSRTDHLCRANKTETLLHDSDPIERQGDRWRNEVVPLRGNENYYTLQNELCTMGAWLRVTCVTGSRISERTSESTPSRDCLPLFAYRIRVGFTRDRAERIAFRQRSRETEFIFWSQNK